MSVDCSLDTVLTPSLELRRLRETHRALMHQMDGDARVHGAERARSTEQTDRFVSAQIEHWVEHGIGMWIAFHHDSLACVGRGGLRHIEVAGESVVQVGYGFFPPYWGRGFATELAMAAANAADALGLARIVGLVRPANLASRRVLEKAGLVAIAEVDYGGLPHLLYERVRESARRPGSRMQA